MKTIAVITCFVGLFVFNTATSNAWYQRHTQGGGSSGFNLVDVKSDIWGTSIWCEGAGSNSCPTKVVGLNPADEAGLDYAQNQIANNILSGTYTMPVTGKVVDWSVTPSESSITVVGPGETLPPKP